MRNTEASWLGTAATGFHQGQWSSSSPFVGDNVDKLGYHYPEGGVVVEYRIRWESARRRLDLPWGTLLGRFKEEGVGVR